MEAYKREFIQFLEGAGVLKFGDFTAKSGRKIPYFINAGDIKTGDQIAKLGEFYAKAYLENKRTRWELYDSYLAHDREAIDGFVNMLLAADGVEYISAVGAVAFV